MNWTAFSVWLAFFLACLAFGQAVTRIPIEGVVIACALSLLAAGLIGAMLKK